MVKFNSFRNNSCLKLYRFVTCKLKDHLNVLCFLFFLQQINNNMLGIFQVMVVEYQNALKIALIFIH